MSVRNRPWIVTTALVCAVAVIALCAALGKLAPLPTTSITTGTTFNPRIRVALTNSPVRSLTIQCDQAVAITAANSDRILLKTEKLSLSEVTATPNGIRIGQHHIPATRIELSPEREPGLWVNRHLYRGQIQIFRMRDGRLRVVNMVRLEDYLASVVDSEMPKEFGSEARKAQCVAARTYALYQLSHRNTHPYFDVYANTRSQMYLGVEYPGPNGQRWAGESKSSRNVVEETRGKVCTHEGLIFCTYFSAACGGRTIEGRDLFSDAADPVRSVDCRWCEEANLYRWEHRLSRERFLDLFDRQNLLSSEHPILLQEAALTILDAEPLDLIQLEQQGTILELQRHSIQKRLGARLLPSPLFRVEMVGEEVVMQGRGHGHGAGFCQWGARGQDREGRDWQTILKTYYPGSQLAQIVE